MVTINLVWFCVFHIYLAFLFIFPLYSYYIDLSEAPQVGKNDLRLKLIHKSLSKQIVGVSKGQRRKKLHENLLKSSQSWSGVSMLQQSHEPKRTSILRHMPPEEVIYDLQTGVSLRKPDSVHEMTGRWAGLGPTTMKTTSGTSGPRVQYASPSGMVQRSSHMVYLLALLSKISKQATSV